MSIERTKSVVLINGNFSKGFFSILKKSAAKRVYVLEGRPHLEGAKTTCRMLLKNKIKPILIADNMAGFLFYQDWVKEVWSSYQEVSRDHVLCTIGSLGLAVMAKRHHIPMKVFPSDQRKKYIAHPKDIFFFEGQRVAARGVHGFVPLLEEVPKKYLSEIYL